MEIKNLPPPNVAPIRSPSAVNDGDVGSNSPFYRRSKKRPHPREEENPKDALPSLEGSSSHIDIRV